MTDMYRKTPTKYEQEHYHKLVGRRVVDIVWANEDGYLWAGLLFDDGTLAFVESDAEGNGPGWLRIQPPMNHKN